MAKKTGKSTQANKDLTGSCYKCKKPVTQDDYCHGCKEYVCQGCDDNADRLMGPHDVQDHFRVEVEADPRD